MNRLDRALGIVLMLRSGKTISASELARRFEVSPRTIYRDIETLGAVGVPVYAEIGRDGGFRLLEGYFLPPVAFSIGEATSLVVGVALLQRLHAKPFEAELETAQHKLLAAVPDHLRAVLAQVQRLVGFEDVPHDSFHPERPAAEPVESTTLSESQVITTFLQAIMAHQAIKLDYRSPYGRGRESHVLAPCGILGDRNRWYLVGSNSERDRPPRLWRADRVISIAPHPAQVNIPASFDIHHLLGRKWLTEAMARWIEEALVVIRMQRAQADRLKQDWYYRHARFEDVSAQEATMTFGESNRQMVFELLRWLGPGAVLLAPEAWRAAFAAEMRVLLTAYET